MFRFTSNEIKNHWIELNEAQKVLSQLMGECLSQSFKNKAYIPNVHEQVQKEMDKLLNEAKNEPSALNEIERESLGLKYKFEILYKFDVFTHLAVISDIQVCIE